MIRFTFHSNCIPVRGFNVSAVFDLHSHSIFLLPNEIYNLLQDNSTIIVDPFLLSYCRLLGVFAKI